MARSSASSRRCRTNGPTAAAGPTRAPVPAACKASSATTTADARTAHSETDLRSAAFTTSVGRTASRVGTGAHARTAWGRARGARGRPRLRVGELAALVVPRDLEQALLDAMVEVRAAEDELAEPVDERLAVDEREALPVANEVRPERAARLGDAPVGGELDEVGRPRPRRGRSTRPARASRRPPRRAPRSRGRRTRTDTRGTRARSRRRTSSSLSPRSSTAG